MKVELFRTYKPNQTLGSAYVVEDSKALFSFKTLELPWLNNSRNISCIPEGTYRVKKHNSPKFKQSFWLQDVPGRSEILIHIGNFTREIRGCILPGSRHADIDGDGLTDVLNSSKTITDLYKLLPDEFEIEIS